MVFPAPFAHASASGTMTVETGTTAVETLPDAVDSASDAVETVADAVETGSPATVGRHLDIVTLDANVSARRSYGCSVT
jgi:hypothetical protein